ncbi:zinc ribbon domain-containing protein [Candidatus Bathyarchaeota archaeon]|nr:zinc ribbon domain-containing protein [Candidatus Bathyarchaeota archaeon]
MICDPEYTMIFYYLSYSQGPLKSRIIEVEKDGEYTIQLRWRRPNNLYEIIEHNQHRIFATPYREVPVENIITQTKTFYSTAMLINVKTLTSYSAITLTEKAPLSHRYGWLPYLLSSLMIGSVAGLAIPFILESRSKRRPKAAVAMPGVKLCPSCGVENPLDAEYCMECGVRLQP